MNALASWFPFVHTAAPGDWAGEMYLSVGVATFGCVVLFALGIAIFEADPDGDEIFAVLLGGGVASLAWGAVVVIGLLALFILGARRLVHGAPRPTPASLEREIDERERELGIGRRNDDET